MNNPPIDVGFEFVSQVGAHLMFQSYLIAFEAALLSLRFQSSRCHLAHDLPAFATTKGRWQPPCSR